VKNISLTKIFTFDSAHHLENYDGVCRNIHGHTYKLEVSVSGEIKQDGMIIDFHKLNDIVKNKILNRIDHRYLNEVFDFSPTCENIACWLWSEIEREISSSGCTLKKIVLWETPTSYVVIED
jgi:6-pyruvoyltetrahydropterin/6-carboxytetrahydropterin synthase